VFNQMTECHRLIDLAKLVSGLTGAEIDFVENPRNEAAENDLFVENRQLLDLGLNPIRLQDDLLGEVTEIARAYAHRCDRNKIPARSTWVQQKEPASPAG
jgi:UDP-sulfoquinovose synthase